MVFNYCRGVRLSGGAGERIATVVAVCDPWGVRKQEFQGISTHDKISKKKNFLITSKKII
jgi:hypothetical protein